MQTHMYDCQKQRDDLFLVMLTEGEVIYAPTDGVNKVDCCQLTIRAISDLSSSAPALIMDTGCKDACNINK